MARRATLFWVGALALFVGALWLLSPILLPFVAGCAIAYFLAPIVERLVRLRVPRGLAAAAVLAVFFVALGTVVLLLVPVIEVETAELVRRAPAMVEAARQEIQTLLEFAQQQLSPEDLAKVKDMAGGMTSAALGWAAQLTQRLLTSGLALANLLSLIVVTPVVAFFLLRDWSSIVTEIDHWLPRRHAETIRAEARLIDATLAGFVHGQFMVGTVLAIYYGGTLTAVGLNFSVILGVLIGVLSFLPVVGILTGLMLALGLALIQFGLSTKFVIVLAIFGVGYAIDSNVLSPRLVGSRVNLHPVWIIFALLAFGSLFGLIGVLLAVPAAAVIGVLIRFAIALYLESPLYDPER
jgi:predicted PurR-regulated permease PerM